MGRFVYRAVDAGGRAVEGEMDADNEAAVIEFLHDGGMFPLSAQPLLRSNGLLSLRARRRLVSSADVANFTTELATMLDAGLALDEALKNLTTLNRKPAVRQLTENLRSAVEAGKPLSDALAAENGTFSPFYVNLVRAGEVSGSLHESLFRLGEYLERSRALANTVTSALAYPAVLMFVAGCALLVLLLYVVPEFEPLFEDLGSALPWSTKFVVGLAAVLESYWWMLIVLAVGLPASLRYVLQDPRRKRAWDQATLALPLVADLKKKIEIARFSRTLGTLLDNGVPILEAVGILRDSMDNLVLRDVLDAAKISLEQGRGLSRPLAASPHIPDFSVQLIEVGESTSTLSKMLLRLGDIYDREVEQSVKRLLTILEPALILGMGVAIGFIIVAILLAILSLNDLVI